MGSVGFEDSMPELEEELRIELGEIGKKLLGLDFDTVDEQINLIERATGILFDVNQAPSDPIKGSLLPITMALALDTNEFLQHENVKIQIAVASCMNELVRISAPESLYNDDHKMEVIFKLIMVVLNLLSDKSASNYDTPLRILETMAKVKTCLFMMDLNSGALVIDMFHLFLNTIRLDHPREIYEYMLVIMTMVIQESDESEISVELVKPLLASVRRENKEKSTLSWELGKTVIETCAIKLKPCIQEAVTSLNLVLDDFAEIVISLCRDTSHGETLTMQSDKGVSSDKSLLGTSRSSEKILLPNGGDLRPVMEHVASIVQSGTHKGYLQRRNSKGPAIRNETTEPSGSSRKEAIDGVSSSKDLDCQKKESLKQQQRRNSKGPTMRNETTEPSGSSRKEAVDGVSTSKDLDFQKKESLKQQQRRNSKGLTMRNETTEPIGSPRKEAVDGVSTSKDLDFQRKESLKQQQRRNSKGPIMRNETTEPSGFSRKEAVDGVSSSKDLDFQKNESLKQQQNDLEWSSAVRKKFRQVKMREPTSSSGCKPAKTNMKNLSRQKEKDPGMSGADYGEELLNLRIKVWWPMDEMFYMGSVIAFDPIQKKHKIRYDDNEIENLNLTVETWEPVVDMPQETRPPLEQEKVDHLPPSEEPVKSREKTVKRKPRLSKDKPSPSSSKRVKRESSSEHQEICALVLDSLKHAKLLPIKEEEHELSCEELGPINHTESRQRVSTRSSKGYHSEQRCGRFFS